MNGAERLLVWLGSCRRDLRSFPREVRREIGAALYAAQQGDTDPAAKPMKGFGGTSFLRSFRTIAAIPGARSTQFVFLKRSTYSTCFRKNQSAGLPRQNRRSK